MKITGEESGEVDLGGFSTPEPGTYDWRVEAGVNLMENDEHSGRTYEIPMSIERVVDGAAEVGETAKLFIAVRSKTGEVLKFGEDRLLGLLAAAGLASKFSKKFAGDIASDDEKFAAAVALKLPGSVVRFDHVLGEYTKDGETKANVNFKKFRPANAIASIPHPATSPQQTSPTPEAVAAADEDW